MIALELLTRPGCHLCDEMKKAVEQAARGLDIRLTETDIDAADDDELQTRYGNDIPVLFVNGSKAFKHRASVAEIKRRLLIADR